MAPSSLCWRECRRASAEVFRASIYYERHKPPNHTVNEDCIKTVQFVSSDAFACDKHRGGVVVGGQHVQMWDIVTCNLPE